MRKSMILGLAAAAMVPNMALAHPRHDDRVYHWAHDDWRSYRETHRPLYARGYWSAPYRYVAFRPGLRIAPVLYGPRVVIAEPWRYHLAPAGPNRLWVRHYDDVLLVDARRGVVIDVYRGFFI